MLTGLAVNKQFINNNYRIKEEKTIFLSTGQ